MKKTHKETKNLPFDTDEQRGTFKSKMVSSSPSYESKKQTKTIILTNFT